MDNRKTIVEELAALGSTLLPMATPLPFRVPEGYFNGFAETMLFALKPLQWRINDLEKQRINPFRVPPGYFEGLPAGMLLKIKEFDKSARQEIEELSPLLAGISRQTPYTVQEEYFQQDAELNAVKNRMVENEISGLLKSLRPKSTYTVPDRFFEEFPALLVAKMRPREGRLVSMSRFSNFRRIAVAAGVAGLVFLGGWYFSQRSAPAGSDFVQMEDITLEELESFAEVRTALAVDYTVNNLEEGSLEEEDFREFFDDFSDQEIQSYLIHYSGLSADAQ